MLQTIMRNHPDALEEAIEDLKHSLTYLMAGQECHWIENVAKAIANIQKKLRQHTATAQAADVVLDVLHYPSQVRNVESWEAELPPSAATDSERQLAEQLLALASGPVDWERYRDTSAEELAALVEVKRTGQPATTAAEEPTVLRLLDALKQSVAAARQGSESSDAKARKPRARRVTA